MDALTPARSLYNSISKRASLVARDLDKLEQKSIIIDRNEAISLTAEAIYFSSKYDASTNYESVAEFSVELASDIDDELEEVEGSGYRLLPFKRNGPDIVSRHVGLGSLYTLKNSEGWKFLKGFEAAELGTQVVEGLSPVEETWIADKLKLESLRIINALRDCSIALRYTSHAIELLNNKFMTLVKESEHLEVSSMLGRLASILAVDGLPPLPAYYSSDKSHVLTEIPKDFLDEINR